MANRQATYFYAPTWDYPPDGPIRLGNVISSVKEPHRPRFYCPPSDESDVSKLEKKSVQYTKEKSKSGRFSILTKFLSILGFGVDVGVEIERRFVQTKVSRDGAYTYLLQATKKRSSSKFSRLLILYRPLSICRSAQFSCWPFVPMLG